MTAKQFYYKVATLRYYQKEYFATRSREALTQAKALEKEIDDEIARVNAIVEQKKAPQPPQNNLFNYNPHNNSNIQFS